MPCVASGETVVESTPRISSTTRCCSSSFLRRISTRFLLSSSCVKATLPLDISTLMASLICPTPRQKRGTPVPVPQSVPE